MFFSQVHTGGLIKLMISLFSPFSADVSHHIETSFYMIGNNGRNQHLT